MFLIQEVVYRFLGETMNLSVDRVPVLSFGHDIVGADVVCKAPVIESNAVPSSITMVRQCWREKLDGRFQRRPSTASLCN